MNKLLTFPGLQPIYLGDIDFLQESVRESFTLLLRGLTGQEKPNCILVQPTAAADGVICIDGEIMPCKSYVGTINQKLSYKVESSYAGERTFKDGTVNKCLETRYAIGYNAPLDAPSFPDFTELLFSSVKLRSGINTNDSVTRSIQIKYAYIGNLYHIEGRVGFLTPNDALSFLVQDMVLDIPGSFASTNSPVYFTMTADIDGTLVSIPAKLVLTYKDIVSCYATITIHPTPIEIGSTASFSFTLTK